jgi:starch phosphorylase
MFQGLWPSLPLNEVPITSITNGVHARSCVAKSTQDLYDRYLGPSWSDAPPENPLWERVKAIPDEELWRNHERCRSDLVVFVRERLAKSLRDRGALPNEIAEVHEVLDPSVLTIGFARRFATYKRATLFLHDLERIKRILLDLDHNGSRSGIKRTVQFIFAGKAHPKDLPGKELIRSIVHFIKEERMHHNVVFLPDYDLYVSRLMVAGCDVWLNTPRRPREASGTSGMKAAMNGLPNLSVLDGWWDEADYVRTGWPIGYGEDYDDPTYQDEVEANTLYNLLEKEVIPLFYERTSEGLPRGWIAKMKEAIHFNCPLFNTSRMVREYAMRAYFPASDRYTQMTTEHCTPAKTLAQWKAHLFEHWYDIKIKGIDILAEDAVPETLPTDIRVNQTIGVKAQLALAALTAEDVQVELYQGSIDATGEIINGKAVEMDFQGLDEQGISIYSVNIKYTSSGLQGLSLRVLPKHADLSNPYEMGLILWAQ